MLWQLATTAFYCAVTKLRSVNQPRVLLVPLLEVTKVRVWLLLFLLAKTPATLARLSDPEGAPETSQTFAKRKLRHGPFRLPPPPAGGSANSSFEVRVRVARVHARLALASIESAT